LIFDQIPGSGCQTIGPVASDGTLNYRNWFVCLETAVFTVSSTTAADNPITNTATCSL
jgi:hypothetical protein